MLPLCFMEKMLSHFNGIRQINMKPPDFSVIHTGKAVIEPAADIDADRIGIFDNCNRLIIVYPTSAVILPAGMERLTSRRIFLPSW